jgi:hypothetical protein
MTIGPAPIINIEEISVLLGMNPPFIVMPAKAGIHAYQRARCLTRIPAFAGMTETYFDDKDGFDVSAFGHIIIRLTHHKG